MTDFSRKSYGDWGPNACNAISPHTGWPCRHPKGHEKTGKNEFERQHWHDPVPEPDPKPPSCREIADALAEHPRLALDVQELMLIRDHPAPGHLVIDRTDDNNIYYIERYALRGQVKATEVVPSNPEFGCNSRFLQADGLHRLSTGGPHGPVIWEIRG